MNGQIGIQEIDGNFASVSIVYDGIKAGGIYKFKDNHDFEFTSDDRAMCYNDGRIEHKRWSVIYKENTQKGKMRLPNRVQVEWHLDDTDLVYFDGRDIEYRFYLTASFLTTLATAPYKYYAYAGLLLFKDGF